MIDYCIQTGRLYESLPYHNAVFVGQDQQGQPRYAALRGIIGDFKGEATGSDKRYSFAIDVYKRQHLGYGFHQKIRQAALQITLICWQSGIALIGRG